MPGGLGGSIDQRVFEHAQSCHEPREYHTWLLTALRDAAGCDGALMRPGPRWAGADTLYLDQGTRFTDVYVEGAGRYGPELARWCELSRGQQAFIDSDVYPARDQRRMAVYSEVIRPDNIGSILACPLSFRGEVLALVFMFRRGTARRFVTEDAQALTRHMPVLALAEKALQTAFALASAPPHATIEAQRFRAAFEDLSRREQQVTALIAKGLQSKEIAQILGTSYHTVRVQTQRIFEKLGLRGRTKVALLMKESGLADRRLLVGKDP